MYLALVFVALLSAAMMVGLMTTLLTVMGPMWRRQSDDVAARSLQDFLRIAPGNPILQGLTVLPPAVGLAIVVIGAPAGGQYLCALLGGAVFAAGFTAWTVVVNLPIYRTVAAWSLTAAPPDFRAVLGQFQRANAVRLAAALATTVLFFLAA